MSENTEREGLNDLLGTPRTAEKGGTDYGRVIDAPGTTLHGPEGANVADQGTFTRPGDSASQEQPSSSAHDKLVGKVADVLRERGFKIVKDGRQPLAADDPSADDAA